MPIFVGRYTELTRLQMPDHISYYLGRWRPDLVAALDGVPGFAAIDVTRFLDSYLAKILEIPPAVVAEDLASFFDPYYFAGNSDPARRQRFVERTLAANVPPSR